MALNYPDRRIKPIVYLISSLRIQLGAFDYLKWGDIEPIMKNDNRIAAKVRVYAQDEENTIRLLPKRHTNLRANG
jgi:hypothetical protein